jgi:hypothetical protein
LLALLLCGLAAPAFASWKIIIRGTDATQLAAPIDHAGAPDVNVSALAAALGMQVRVIGGDAVLFDAKGTEWRGRAGSLAFETIGRSLPLRSPLLLQGTVLFLPLETVAELAGLRLDIDPAAQRAILGDVAPPAGSRPGGLQAFTLEKTPAEKALEAADPANAAAPAAKAFKPRLPAATERLRLDYGVGYVQGYDAGMELSASGRSSGIDVALNTLFTMGGHGPQIKNGYLALSDAPNGREFDIGQLVSDLHGSFLGARFGWRSGRSRSSVSISLASQQSLSRRPVIDYQDETEIGPGLRIGGQIASDGSLFAKGAVLTKRFSLFGYYRTGPDRFIRGAGAFFSVNLGRGVSLYGGVSRSGTGSLSYDWRSVAVTLPLRRGIDLTLEHSQSGAVNSGNSLNAVMLSLPVGRMRLLTRYQFGVSQAREALLSPIWLRPQQRDLMFSSALFSNPRVSMNYQASLRWQQDNGAVMTGQLMSMFRFSDRAKLEMFSGFPQALDPTQLRISFTYGLRKDLDMSLDYGLLSPFQNVNTHADERGLMMMVRSHVEVATPARGTDVSGQVTDQLAHPVREVLVKLGEYQVQTDKGGRYLFPHVPAGEYVVGIDEENLAADYKIKSGHHAISLNRQRTEKVDFQVVQLRTITGHVTCGTRGKRDRGEGVGGVVVFLGDFATSTADDGSFAFYNVEPGAHTIRLDTERLSKDYDTDSPTTLRAELTPGGSVADLSFRLIKHEKAVIFQPLP